MINLKYTKKIRVCISMKDWKRVQETQYQEGDLQQDKLKLEVRLGGQERSLCNGCLHPY